MNPILHAVARAFVFIFPVSEVLIAARKRARPGSAMIQDRGSVTLLWIVITVSVALAVIVSGWPPGRLSWPPAVRNLLAILFLAGGLALRWTSIATLGRFFTVNVAVHDGQRVIDTGPYRFIRHPSYTGLLMAFLGVGLYFGNWVSLGLLMIPITLGLLKRIQVEEAALTGSLGEAYTAYCRRTKRLIPGIL